MCDVRPFGKCGAASAESRDLLHGVSSQRENLYPIGGRDALAHRKAVRHAR